MISKVFVLDSAHSIAGIARAMADCLRKEENMDVTRYRHEDGSYLVRARSRNGGALRWLGLDQNILISVHLNADGNAVAEVTGSWRDKGLALGTSLFMLWPLALTAGAGAVRQARLPGRLFSAARLYLQHPPFECSRCSY